MTRSTLIHGSCDDLRVLALRREGEPVITGRSRMPVRGNDTLARQVRGNLGVYLPAACRSPPDAACRSPLGARNMSFRYTPRRLPIAYSPGRNKWEGEVKRRRKRICCFQERLLWRSRSHRSSGVVGAAWAGLPQDGPMTWSRLRERPGCGWHKIGHRGDLWGRPMPSSGRLMAE
ncbi:hypothetical protein RR46_10756 [Papilio xuthus]|uniref:Uncharacterized protein n=1 Tax=Papilio xuthus TaxID=66420 RepID=A0A194PJ95_PAPXU|nr:hypothetical protein RR46_10756 [Papilio xuthus]